MWLSRENGFQYFYKISTVNLKKKKNIEFTYLISKKILSLNDDVEEVYDEESCLVLSGNALKYPEIEVNLKFIITVHKIGSD